MMCFLTIQHVQHPMSSNVLTKLCVSEHHNSVMVGMSVETGLMNETVVRHNSVFILLLLEDE